MKFNGAIRYLLCGGGVTNTMADEKKDNLEVALHSPIGGYGMTDNTGAGIMSGAVSNPGRGLEDETAKKTSIIERILKSKDCR